MNSKTKKKAPEPQAGAKRKSGQVAKPPAKPLAEKRKKLGGDEQAEITYKKEEVKIEAQEPVVPAYVEDQETILRRNEKLVVVKEENDGQDIKWKSLEHRGVTFESRYEPHGVKLLYKVRIKVMT